MHLVAIAWIYVVLMMALAEALSSQGTVLGAVITLVAVAIVWGMPRLAPVMGGAVWPPFYKVLGAVITFVLYGLLPLSVLLYIMGAPARGRARRTAEAAAVATAAPSATPDGGGMAPGDAVAPEGKEA